MRTFITGATGYIGFNVAKAMRRAGHKVYGLTRNKDKAGMLAKAEIHPVIGDMDNPGGFVDDVETFYQSWKAYQT